MGDFGGRGSKSSKIILPISELVCLGFTLPRITSLLVDIKITNSRGVNQLNKILKIQIKGLVNIFIQLFTARPSRLIIYF